MTEKRYSILNSTPEEVQDYGGKGIKDTRYSGIIFATMTEEKAKLLGDTGAVVAEVPSIKADTDTVAPPVPIVSVPKYTPAELIAITGLEDLRNVTDPPLYGAGINLAIIGTGMLETHEQLLERVVYRENFTTEAMEDRFDHDTGVASIALALAPECGILNMKVIDHNGDGSEESVVLAIEKCIALHEEQSSLAPSVLNLSLGTHDDGNRNTPMRVACRTAIAVGIWVFASSGNSGPYGGTIMSPACERYVFAVGSIMYLPDESSFIVSDFSSRGPTYEGVVKPDAVLFGEDLVMASSANNTATTYKSGTSFTAPFAAGMAVLFLEGVARRAETLVRLGQLESAMFYYVPASEVMDQHLSRICTKPADSSIVKSNVYGEGLPLGSLITQALQPVEGGETLMGVMPLLVVIPMMGMLMKTMTENAVTSKK